MSKVPAWMQKKPKMIWYTEFLIGKKYDFILIDVLNYEIVPFNKRRHYIQFRAVSLNDYNEFGLIPNEQCKLQFSNRGFEYQWQLKNKSALEDGGNYSFRIVFERTNIKKFKIHLLEPYTLTK